MGSPNVSAAAQKEIDIDHSSLTIHVGKSGILAAAGHEHTVTAPIKNGVVWAALQLAWTVMLTSRMIFVYGPERYSALAALKGDSERDGDSPEDDRLSWNELTNDFFLRSLASRANSCRPAWSRSLTVTGSQRLFCRRCELWPRHRLARPFGWKAGEAA